MAYVPHFLALLAFICCVLRLITKKPMYFNIAVVLFFVAIALVLPL